MDEEDGGKKGIVEDGWRGHASPDDPSEWRAAAVGERRHVLSECV